LKLDEGGSGGKNECQEAQRGRQAVMAPGMFNARYDGPDLVGGAGTDQTAKLIQHATPDRIASEGGSHRADDDQ